MATAKTPNYTPEQTEKAKADYLAGVTVEAIAAALGKNVKSVVAKLSREGVYKPKVYVSKTGEKPVKKDDLADSVAKSIGVILGGSEFALTESETESLAKANKTAILKIARALAMSKPIEPGDGNGE